MILKILLTLIIVIAVFIWYRAQKSKRMMLNGSTNNYSQAREAVPNKWIKSFAYSISGLIIAAGIIIYYFSWQEENSRYQVTITNPKTGTSENFIALKKNMRGRLFITQSGREIRISDWERIEITKLDVPE